MFVKEKLFSENIINIFFKILEKMNLVQLSIDNYNRQKFTEKDPNSLPNISTMKILYCSTDFVRQMRLKNPDMMPISYLS